MKVVQRSSRLNEAQGRWKVPRRSRKSSFRGLRSLKGHLGATEVASLKLRSDCTVRNLFEGYSCDPLGYINITCIGQRIIGMIHDAKSPSC